MASPKRDQYKAAAGKMLDSADAEFDLTELLKKIDAITSAISGIKVDATIETGDIEIGAVELKDAGSDTRAKISAANAARAASDNVVLVQTADPAGNTPAVETAGADAVSNTTNAQVTKSRLKGFNGTTWDRIRSGLTAVTATFTGILNTLPWNIYHLTPSSRTDGQGGPLEADANGNTRIAEQYASQADDQTFHVYKTQTQARYAVPITASALVATGAGQLMGFVVNSCAAGATLKIWDNTSAATTVMFDTMTFTTAVAEGPRVVALPAATKFIAGCYFTIGGAAMSVTPIFNP